MTKKEKKEEKMESLLKGVSQFKNYKKKYTLNFVDSISLKLLLV